MSLKPRIQKNLRRLVAPVRRRLAPELEVTVNGERFRVDLRDRIIGTLVYLDGDFERHLRDVLVRLDLEGKFCVDVGANIGLHTVFLSRRVGANGKVFAFEPERHNFDLLQRNIALNGLTNVEAHRMALSDHRGFAELSVDAVNFGNHHITASNAAQTQRIETVEADSVLEKTPPGSIGFIKIDVQGHEVSVLRGMRRTLERNPGVILCVEVSPSHLRDAGTSARELVDELRALGFQGYEIQAGRVLPTLASEQYEWMGWQVYADLLLGRASSQLNDVMSGVISEYSRPSTAS